MARPRAEPAGIVPSWRADTQTCRLATDALPHGRIGPAADTVTPDGAADRVRRDVRALMRRLASRLAVATEGPPPRLERVLPALRLDGIEAATDVRSFGDRAVFLVGCGIRPLGDIARIGIEAYPTREGVLSGLRATLLDGAPDGDGPDAEEPDGSGGGGAPP